MANTKENGTLIKGTGPLSGRFPSTLSGVETLDLSVAAPAPTPHFSLAASQRAKVVGSGSTSRASWQIEPGGYLQFQLSLGYQHGVALILELGGTDGDKSPEFSLNIGVNNYELEIAGLPGKGSFYKRSWYLIPDWLNARKSLITIKLSEEASAPILLRSAAVMRFNLQRQEQKLWCWAAVTAGVRGFFDPGRSLTQSEVVETCLGQVINETLELAQALKKMGVLACAHEAVPALGEIRKQISAGLPVPVRIGWTAPQGKRRELTGRGHFVVIAGVLQRDPRGDDDTLVRVADPATETAAYMPYGILKHSYKYKGILTHFYILKRQDARREPTS